MMSGVFAATSRSESLSTTRLRFDTTHWPAPSAAAAPKQPSEVNTMKAIVSRCGQVRRRDVGREAGGSGVVGRGDVGPEDVEGSDGI